MNKVNDNAPKTYEDWLETDHIIIPCENKRSVVKKWSDINFKITKAMMYKSKPAKPKAKSKPKPKKKPMKKGY